jgi:predicted ATPase/DNA-binding SARP family transcriptional activator
MTAMSMADQELRVRVLGAPGLEVPGSPPVELASAKAAALIYYLAVTGAAHPRSALAGLLWSDLPEATARANLRLVLTKLRRALPDHLTVTRHTVALSGPVRVDAVEVGRVASADDDGADLPAAVRLCRGDLLQGFGVPGAPVFDQWLAARRATARADMLAVLERAVRWAREQRDPAAGVEAARRMLELDSLYEEAHRALMCFLAMGGRRGAALAQFETCRYLLADELGVEPSKATLALRDEITAASGGGFTELVRPPAAVRREQIPAPLTTLVGRDRELNSLHDLLDDPACRLVTLVGPGGIGKTRLAVEIAAARRERHRDGTVFASFVGAELIVPGLAQALGVPTGVPREPVDLLADHLAGQAILLVLDNLEHTRDAPEVIAGLLRRSPGTQVLVTSRRRLGIGVEWLFEVPGLCHPEAVRLFQERARLLRPGSPGPADLAGADRVCRLLQGMPLAIELAARWVRSATPAAIADRLAEGIELLATTAGDVDPRHRSIRSVIDSSCALLGDDETRTLRRLSVLRGGFDLAACAAVADAGLPLLAALVEQSLVTAGEDGRYAMHELLRQYAAELLAADPAEEVQTRQRHAEHYAALTPTADEAENLRAATDWLVAHGEPATLDAHLRRIWTLYRRMGWFRQAQTFFAAALRRTDSTPLQRGRWHRLLGEAHQQVGETQPAREHLERALTGLGGQVPATLPVQLARRAVRGRRPARADALEAARERAAASFTIVEVYWVLEEHGLVLPAAIQSLTDAEEAGDPEAIVRVQAGLAMVEGTAGWHRLARHHMSAASAGAELTDDAFTACWVGIVGGLHWLGVGDWAAVDAATARVQRLPERTPLHRWTDEARVVSAAACYLTARYPEATAAATAAVVSSRARHDAVVQFWGLIILIETGQRAGTPEAELAAWSAEAAELLPKVARIDAARLHVAIARRHLAAGRPAEAWQSIRTADRLTGPGPASVQYALDAHAGIPEVCLALLETEDRAEVRALAASGLRRLRRYARTFPTARPGSLILTGRVALLNGRPRAAARAWTRAVHAAERLSMPYELSQARDLLDRSGQ